jgi:phospholipase C
LTTLHAAVSRRRFLRLAALAAGGAVAGTVIDQTLGQPLIEHAFDFDPLGTGSLSDVDHFVLLMQENRSFDHYFGTMSGVRGFAGAGPVLEQRGYRPGSGPDPNGVLLPYRLNTRLRSDADTDIIGDPRHDWRTQHASWNRGRMDAWMSTHAAVDPPAVAPAVMGYYTRADLPTHYALADAFTICDNYFSSVLGPTAPNRLYWMTGTIDPEGAGGGPIGGNREVPAYSLTWPTFPEVLQDAGVSWKIYNQNHPADQGSLSGMARRFRAYRDPGSELHKRAITPYYPSDFAHDVATGQLPSVSWIIPSLQDSEHPSYPPAIGAWGIVQVLATLVTNPAVWERTALIVSYDENGGLFDHVAPPVPPVGTPGEYLHTAPRQPIGLGFRVPCLVLSPFTRGCYVNSDLLDHTSQLRLLGTRFGVPVPNVSDWRRRTTGDMRGLFERTGRPDPAIPRLGDVRDAADDSLTGDRTAIAHGVPGTIPSYLMKVHEAPGQARQPIRHRLR